MSIKQGWRDYLSRLTPRQPGHRMEPGITINPDAGEDIWVGGLRLSAEYAGFSRGNVMNNEREFPGQGFTVPYHGGANRKATIFIYDKGLRDIPDDPLSELVRQEFDQAWHEVVALYSPHKRVELVIRYCTRLPQWLVTTVWACCGGAARRASH
jgi:hypothetical protein